MVVANGIPSAPAEVFVTGEDRRRRAVAPVDIPVNESQAPAWLFRNPGRRDLLLLSKYFDPLL